MRHWYSIVMVAVIVFTAFDAHALTISSAKIDTCS